MRIRRKKVRPWQIHPEIELTAFGAAAVLRALGYHNARGKPLLKLESAPERRGRFTKFYRMKDIEAWAKSVAEYAKYKRTNGFMGVSEPLKFPKGCRPLMHFPEYDPWPFAAPDCPEHIRGRYSAFIPYRPNKPDNSMKHPDWPQ